MILRIRKAELAGEFRVRLAFNDGSSGEADFLPLLQGPIFELLRNPEYFRRMKLDPICGTVVWPNGADLAPEAIRACLVSESKAASTRKSMMPSRRFRIALFTSALVAAITSMILWFIFFPGRSFDRELWLSSKRAEYSNRVRFDMATRLNAHRILIGKSRTELFEMLGDPAFEDPPGSGRYRYDVGPAHEPFRMKTLWFIVFLGPDDVVEGCQLRGW